MGQGEEAPVQDGNNQQGEKKVNKVESIENNRVSEE
jgi:hypothetical protein